MPNADSYNRQSWNWRLWVGQLPLSDTFEAQIGVQLDERKGILTCASAARNHGTPSTAGWRSGFATFAQNYRITNNIMVSLSSIAETLTTMLYQERAWIPVSRYWHPVSLFSSGTGSNPAQFPEAPHGGRYVLVSFGDGHVEKTTLTLIPTESTSAPGMQFWRGQ